MISYITAEPKFAEPAARLLHATMGPFADAVLGLDDHPFCLDLLAEMFTRENNRFSHDRAMLGIQGGEVAALLLAFPGCEIGGRNRAFLRQAMPVYGTGKYLRFLANFFQTFASKETEKDQYYIAHLAVNPTFHRQGIAKVLLSHAQVKAKEAGLRKVSLQVELGNNPAIALYQGAGFTITATHPTPRLEKRFHSPGYHHMVKNI